VYVQTGAPHSHTLGAASQSTADTASEQTIRAAKFTCIRDEKECKNNTDCRHIKQLKDTNRKIYRANSINRIQKLLKPHQIIWGELWKTNAQQFMNYIFLNRH
jgi:hypothetical protein